MNTKTLHRRSSVGLLVVASFILLTLCYTADVAASEFTVDSWDLGISVGAGFPNSVGGFFNQVQSPFVDSHSVTLLPNYPNSTVSASYDIAFDETSGLARFLLEPKLDAEGIGPGTTLLCANSTSRINITPFVPITVLIHAEYTFDLPVDHIHTGFAFSATGVTSQSVAFLDHHAFSTTMGPGLDTFTIDGQFVLTPNESWRLLAIMDIDMLSGTQGSVGIGSGFFDIQIVPEPATLIICTTLILLFRRSRRASA